MTSATKLFSTPLHLTTMIFAVVTIMVTVTAQPTFGQSDMGQQANKKGVEKIEINQKDIQNYAEARQKVDKISKKVRGKVEDMNKDEKQDLNVKLVNTVTQTGISVDAYNAITDALAENKELQKRVIQAMQKGLQK